jgi:ribosomal protein S18 acetylase RimI-like enzyme
MPTSEITIRTATREDIPPVVALLADDPLGASREDANNLAPYQQAFEAVAAQGGNYLLIAERDNMVVGCLQLTIIPGLSRRGMTRGLIEGVRVRAACRGLRIGEQLIRHAIELSREAGCGLVQLTTDKSRTDAHRFYQRLGFVASHEGMKLALA